MAKLFPARQKKRRPRIEIIPMVDVMFLLLVFYILSSLALHHHLGIQVALPSASSSQPAATEQEIVLTIKPTGEYYVNDKPIQLPDLPAVLASLPGGLERARRTPIMLNADLAAQHRYVVAVMDELRKLDINEFVISTAPPQ